MGKFEEHVVAVPWEFKYSTQRLNMTLSAEKLGFNF